MNRFLCVLLITWVSCNAQSIHRNENQLLFKEATTAQPLLIIKDSLLYKGNPLQQKAFLHSLYLDNIKNYIPMEIGKKNYFVHSGCGPVLEWRNDSIVRIDKSFLHQNQYGAVPFVYNNTLFFLGGYGLFTHKNILTRFDFKTKEWFEVETFGNPPSPRRQAHGIVIGAALYVFDGYEKDEKRFTNIRECDPVIYKLDLLSMQWSTIGRYAPIENINSKEAGNATSFTVDNKLYILPLSEYDTTYEIDFINNTVTTHKGFSKNVIYAYFDSKTNEVTALIKNANGSKYVFHSPLKEFLGKPVAQQEFILPWYKSVEKSTILLSFLGILGVLSSVFYFSKRKTSYKPFAGITFKSAEANYYYKGKLLDTLEEAELRILEYLVQNRQRFIPLNELNHLYENEIQIDNFTTVVKRREIALSNLFAKLAFVTEKSEENILVYRKNPNDKRVKEIKLKEDFIRIK